MTEEQKVALRSTGDWRLAEEWQLVLVAQGLSASLQRSDAVLVVVVPELELDRARDCLLAYDRENLAKLSPSAEPVVLENLIAGAAVGLLLLLFYSISTQWLANLPWYERGSADAERILQGELWRTVTALTLHADIAHVLGNAVAAAIFLTAVSAFIGFGVGGACVLLASAAGNLVNSYLHGVAHISVGASTAVFAAVGLLASLGITHRRRNRQSGWRVWQPVAAALALLGMLGSSGQRVDIGAHLTGLALGGVVGLPAGMICQRAPAAAIQWLSGAAAIAVILYCWFVALT